MPLTVAVHQANRCQNRNHYFHWCEIDLAVAVENEHEYINHLVGRKEVKQCINIRMMCPSLIHRRSSHRCLWWLVPPRCWFLACVCVTTEADSRHCRVLCPAKFSTAKPARQQLAAVIAKVPGTVAEPWSMSKYSMGYYYALVRCPVV